MLLLLTLIGLVCAGVAAAWYGFVLGPRQLVITTATVAVPNLPPELEGLRLLHYSDWHLRPWDIRGERFYQRLREVHGDLAFHTGDFIELDEGIPLLHRYIRQFRGGLGTWGILGNHDYYWFPYDNLIKRRKRTDDVNNVPLLVATLEEQGITVLRNNWELREVRGRRVLILGLDDNVTEHHHSPALADAPEADLRICLVHSPDYLAPDEQGVVAADVYLCGHTHGGQFRLPRLRGGTRALVTSSKLRGESCSGLYRHGQAVVSISRGLGTTHFLPVRFLCPPEMVVLELRREAEGELPELAWA